LLRRIASTARWRAFRLIGSTSASSSCPRSTSGFAARPEAPGAWDSNPSPNPTTLARSANSAQRLHEPPHPLDRNQNPGLPFGCRGGSSFKKMVGAPGFEPGTSPPQTVRATRLRHAPTRVQVYCRSERTRSVHAWRLARNRVSRTRTVRTPWRERQLRLASCLLFDLRGSLIARASIASVQLEKSRSSLRLRSAWYWIEKLGVFSVKRRIQRPPRAAAGTSSCRGQMGPSAADAGSVRRPPRPRHAPRC